MRSPLTRWGADGGSELDRYGRVNEFHRKFGQPRPISPTMPTPTELRFRMRIMLEEMCELCEAVYGHEAAAPLRELLRELQQRELQPDFEAFFDALVDVNYTTDGTHVAFGVFPGPLHAEVHRSNMEKEPAGGALTKPSKPPNWRPPDLKQVLADLGCDVEAWTRTYRSLPRAERALPPPEEHTAEPTAEELRLLRLLADAEREAAFKR